MNEIGSNGPHFRREAMILSFLGTIASAIILLLSLGVISHMVRVHWRKIAMALNAEILVLQPRSEEHTSELQSLMRISYAVFCLKKKNNNKSTYLLISLY